MVWLCVGDAADEDDSLDAGVGIQHYAPPPLGLPVFDLPGLLLVVHSRLLEGIKPSKEYR